MTYVVDVNIIRSVLIADSMTRRLLIELEDDELLEERTGTESESVLPGERGL